MATSQQHDGLLGGAAIAAATARANQGDTRRAVGMQSPSAPGNKVHVSQWSSSDLGGVSMAELLLAEGLGQTAAEHADGHRSWSTTAGGDAAHGSDDGDDDDNGIAPHNSNPGPESTLFAPGACVAAVSSSFQRLTTALAQQADASSTVATASAPSAPGQGLAYRHTSNRSTGHSSTSSAASTAPAPPFSQWALTMFASLRGQDARLQALRAYLRHMGGAAPLSLLRDDPRTLATFQSQLEATLRSCTSSTTAVTSPPSSTAPVKGRLQQQLTTASLAAMLSTALHCGDVGTLITALERMLTLPSTKPLTPLQWSARHVDALAQSCSIAVPVSDPACSAAWLHAPPPPLTADANPELSDKRRLVAAASATDGRFLYIHNAQGLAKIGTGHHGTVRGRVYAFREGYRADATGVSLLFVSKSRTAPAASHATAANQSATGAGAGAGEGAGTSSSSTSDATTSTAAPLEVLTGSVNEDAGMLLFSCDSIHLEGALAIVVNPETLQEDGDSVDLPLAVVAEHKSSHAAAPDGSSAGPTAGSSRSSGRGGSAMADLEAHEDIDNEDDDTVMARVLALSRLDDGDGDSASEPDFHHRDDDDAHGGLPGHRVYTSVCSDGRFLYGIRTVHKRQQGRSWGSPTHHYHHHQQQQQHSHAAGSSLLGSLVRGGSNSTSNSSSGTADAVQTSTVVDVMDAFEDPAEVVGCWSLPSDWQRSPPGQPRFAVTFTVPPSDLLLSTTRPMVVTGFSGSSSAAPGPAQADGRIRAGQTLVAVNGRLVAGLSPPAVAALMAAPFAANAEEAKANAAMHEMADDSKADDMEQDHKSKDDDDDGDEASAPSSDARARDRPRRVLTLEFSHPSTAAADDPRRQWAWYCVDGQLVALCSLPHDGSGGGADGSGGGGAASTSAPSSSAAPSAAALGATRLFRFPPSSILQPPPSSTATSPSGGAASATTAATSASPVARVFRPVRAASGRTRYECRGDWPLAAVCLQAGRRSAASLLAGLEPCVEPRPAAFNVDHTSVTCDACGQFPLHGPRYKDHNQFDFDLCHGCYSAGAADLSHRFQLMESQHAVTAILPPRTANVARAGTFARANLPSAACYDAVNDKLLFYFAGTREVQLWDNAGVPTRFGARATPPVPEASAAASSLDLRPRQLAARLLACFAKLARVYLANSSVAALPQAVLQDRQASSPAVASAAPDAAAASGDDAVPLPAGWRPLAVPGLAQPVYHNAETGEVQQVIETEAHVVTRMPLPVYTSRQAAGKPLCTIPAGSTHTVVARCGDWLRVAAFPEAATAAEAALQTAERDQASGAEASRNPLAMLVSQADSARRLDLEALLALRSAIDSGRAHGRRSLVAGSASGATGPRTDLGGAEDVAGVVASLWVHAPPLALAPSATPPQHTLPTALAGEAAPDGDEADAEAGDGGEGEGEAPLTVGTQYGSGCAVWSGSALSLVGARIEVLWARNRWFQGVVADYNDGQHFVCYDDGDRRWYNMPDKTFRIVGLPPATAGDAGAAGSGEAGGNGTPASAVLAGGGHGDGDASPEATTGAGEAAVAAATGVEDGASLGSSGDSGDAALLPLLPRQPTPMMVPFCINVQPEAAPRTFSALLSLMAVLRGKLQAAVGRPVGAREGPVLWTQLLLHCMRLVRVNLRALVDSDALQDESAAAGEGATAATDATPAATTGLAALAASGDGHADGKPYRSTLWLFDRGIDAVKAGRLLEAIELFKQCARRRTRDHSSAYNLACCYSLLGDVDMGLWWLRKAVRCG